MQNHWGDSISSEVTCTIIMIAAGTLLALLYVICGNNYFVGLVVMWSLFGITSKRQMAGDDGAKGIISAAWMSIGLIVGAIIVQALKYKKILPQP